jgi:hypothetical protein
MTADSSSSPRLVKEFETFLKDIHEIAKGRLKDWKEDEHLSDNLLFRLAERED